MTATYTYEDVKVYEEDGLTIVEPPTGFTVALTPEDIAEGNTPETVVEQLLEMERNLEEHNAEVKRDVAAHNARLTAMGVYEEMSNQEFVEVVRDAYLNDGHTVRQMMKVGLQVQYVWDTFDEDFEVTQDEAHCFAEWVLYEGLCTDREALEAFWTMMEEDYGYVVTETDEGHFAVQLEGLLSYWGNPHEAEAQALGLDLDEEDTPDEDF